MRGQYALVSVKSDLASVEEPDPLLSGPRELYMKH
jgi:hypothetical protein